MSGNRLAAYGSALLGCFALIWACSGEDSRVPANNDAGSGGSEGGSGGTGGSGGSLGASGGQGGSIETDCNGTHAFLAPNAVAVFPTPRALAGALNSLLYRPAQGPLGIVLVLRDGRGRMALSALEEAESGVMVFPEAMHPELVAVRADDDGFASAAEQANAYLRLIDESGAIFLELQAVTLSAITTDNCSHVQVSVNAVIPESQTDVELQLPDRSVTVGELAAEDMGNGGRDTGEAGWPLALTFSADSTDFDFSTL